MANTIEIVIKALNEASGTFKDVEEDAGGLAKALEGIGKAALGVAVAGVTAVVGGLIGAISEASEAQEIMGKLDITLGNLGLAGSGAREAILETAGALQDVTRFSDDAAIAAQNMLLQMGVAASDLPNVTGVTADLASALGIDLTSAAQTVGRALADPTTAAGRLMRMNIVLTDAQQAQIKAFMDAGNAAGAQAVILDTLKGKYGGAAEAAGTTFAGQIDRLKNSFGGILETIGMAVLPSLQLLADALLTALNDPAVQAGIQALVTWLGDNLPIAIGWLIGAVTTLVGFIQGQIIPAIQAFLGNGPLVAAALGLIALGFGVWAVSAASAALATIAAAAPVLAILALIGGAIALLYTAWTQNWGGIQQVVANFWAQIQPSLQAIWDGIVLVFNAIVTFVQTNMGTLQAIVGGVWTAIQGVIQVVMGVIQGIIQAVGAAIQGDWTGVWSAVLTMFANIWNGIVMFMQGIGAILWNVLDLALKALGTNLQTQLENIRLWFVTAWNNILLWFENLPTVLANIGKNIIDGLLGGLKAAWQSVVDWCEGAVKWISDTFNSAMGIQSPSSVMADIGKNISLGLAEGLSSVPVPLPQMGQEGNGGSTLNYAPTYNFGPADAGTVHALQRRELTEAAVFSGS